LTPVEEWIAERRASTPYRVERIPLPDIPNWRAVPGTGDLEHESGRFFAVRGLAVAFPDAPDDGWQQPILDQPEVGILGILCRRTADGYDYLLHAKMEPGNSNLVQLSPTLQATFSNYTRVHRGRVPPYLDHFDGTRPAPALADSLQPETGTRFWQKRNRNVIIEVDPGLPVAAGFRWVSQQELADLLLVDDLVNIDARSVLATLPRHEPCSTAAAERAVAAVRAGLRVDRRVIPLADVAGWAADRDGIRHETRNYFEVVGVRVAAADREVPSWGQPLLLHRGLGLAALFTRRDRGVHRYLFQVKFEAGNRRLTELAPTVSVFDYEARHGAGVDVPGLREFMDLPAEAVLLSTVQSEEGGRFCNLRNRYVIAEVGDVGSVTARGDFVWLSRAEAKSCLGGEYLVNSEARTLILYTDLLEGALDA
jgi:oxidase EvaA